MKTSSFTILSVHRLLVDVRKLAKTGNGPKGQRISNYIMGYEDAQREFRKECRDVLKRFEEENKHIHE